MKIVKASEMSRLESLAYAEGASEEAFMNRAAEGIAEWALSCIARYHLKPQVILLCGRGNNGGDAFAAGTLLVKGGFQTTAYAMAPLNECSPLCQLQCRRFTEQGGTVVFIQDPSEIHLREKTLILDGLLGTGFHGKVTGLLQGVIEKVNRSNFPVFSIDIPSGINGTTGEIGGTAIQARETLFLGMPKKGCFLGETWDHVGKTSVFDFGLGQKWIDQAEYDFQLIEPALIKRLLPPIKRTRHKYQAGYVVGWGGSWGMPGAPLMASYAALRAGAGIVRLLHPEGLELELGAAPLELVRESYRESEGKKIIDAMERASAVFIGPGFGIHPRKAKLFKKVLANLNKPCVIDADALSLFRQLSGKFRSQVILTPHHGEMKRLLQWREERSLEELFEAVQEFVRQHQIILVLKGAPTFIFHPEGKPYVCSRGDPGMATAGSGDVLTGMLAAFLAQGKAPLEAALLGVYVHALSGEKAAMDKTSYCLIAGDIIEYLPAAFKELLL